MAASCAVGCTGSSEPVPSAPGVEADANRAGTSAGDLGGNRDPAERAAQAAAQPSPPTTDSTLLVARRASHAQMIERLEELSQQMSLENPYLGDNAVRTIRKRLDELTFTELRPSLEKWQLCEKLGHAELRLGNERDAIEQFQRAFDIGKRIPSAMPPGSASDTFFSLGVGYMRLGETENCCVQNNPESCLFPIRPAAVHTKTEGSSEAIRALEQTLQLTPAGTVRYKQTVWLLNIAYMTLGQYPDAVPAEFLIPPSAFQSDAPFPPFPNVAAKAGVNTFSLSGGVIADDFDNDGDIDLMVSTWEHTGQLKLFRNRGDGTFEDITEPAGLTGLFGGLNMVQADYNNDGHVDVLVLRGAWLANYGEQPNSLLRNNGDGTFSDVTHLAGMADINRPTQAAAWADYDLDGDLDLFVGNEPVGSYSADLSSEQFIASQLYRNNGDETFTDVAVAAGVTNDRYAKGVTWGDFDNDRWPDLYVSNLKDKNRLYRNNGDGTFTDIAESLGVTGPTASFPAWFWDYDNDGQLDIFASAYDGRTDDLVDYYLKNAVTAETPKLYRGTGTEFRDVAPEVNLMLPSLPMGSNFGDLDNDGYLDFYLGTGDPNYQQLMPNIMYHNLAGRRFADVTIAGGFGNLQKGHGVAFADFDSDGDLDLFEQMGGAFRGDRYYDTLYQNPGFGHHWLALQLVGSRSNRSAIGARIRADIEEPDDKGLATRRSIYRHVNSGGSFGCNPLRQHLGIGRAQEILKLEIYWPASDTRQIFEHVAPDRLVRIVEGHDVLLMP